MVQERVGAVFLPHGLGHLLGIDTHDPGGYLKVITITENTCFLLVAILSKFRNTELFARLFTLQLLTCSREQKDRKNLD